MMALITSHRMPSVLQPCWTSSRMRWTATRPTPTLRSRGPCSPSARPHSYNSSTASTASTAAGTSASLRGGRTEARRGAATRRAENSDGRGFLTELLRQFSLGRLDQQAALYGAHSSFAVDLTWGLNDKLLDCVLTAAEVFASKMDEQLSVQISRRYHIHPHLNALTEHV